MHFPKLQLCWQLQRFTWFARFDRAQGVVSSMNGILNAMFIKYD